MKEDYKTKKGKYDYYRPEFLDEFIEEFKQLINQ